MSSAVVTTNSSVFPPLSCQAVSELLRIRVLQWSQKTGLPASIQVRINGKNFSLHQHPLCSLSGYFKRALEKSVKLELPDSFPGGSENFELVILFFYAGSIPISAFNVTAVRCAAEFLDMTEDYISGNLIEMCDLYLNQVVLQSWDDTLIVLQKCQTLLPWAEDLLIVRRCVESLAFMACMQILDPELRREWPFVTLQALTSHSWGCGMVKEFAVCDSWVRDLIALPVLLFKRVIESLRKQGMKEKYISPIIVLYGNKWVLLDKAHLCCEDLKNGMDPREVPTLQGVIELLPVGEKSSRVIPITFYFALLSRYLKLGSSDEYVTKLKRQIVPLLHMAQLDDFPFPESTTDSPGQSLELMVMESIVSEALSLKEDIRQILSSARSIIAEVWDNYISVIAGNPLLELKRFLELIEIIPASDRHSHDPLYRAICTFLMVRPLISQEDKALVCRYLDCQKLSLETCIEAVQNEWVPLRLIVQALFVQQLNTREMLTQCTNSALFAQYDDNFPIPSMPHSAGLSVTSSRGQAPKSGGEIPWRTEYRWGSASSSLKCLLQKEANMQMNEYDSTSFRIRNVEEELLSLKKSLKSQNASKMAAKRHAQSFRIFARSNMKRNEKTISEVGSCIGAVNRASQKCANSLLKVFQRLSMSGRYSSKKRHMFSRSGGTSPCRKIRHVHQIA